MIHLHNSLMLECLGSSETINTSITPDYVTEDWNAIQSASAAPLAEPLKVDEPAQNNVIDKTR